MAAVRTVVYRQQFWCRVCTMPSIADTTPVTLGTKHPKKTTAEKKESHSQRARHVCTSAPLYMCTAMNDHPVCTQGANHSAYRSPSPTLLQVSHVTARELCVW